MKEISEITAFTEEFEIVHLPASRIIGKEIKSGGNLGNTAPSLWDGIYASQDHITLEELPQVISKDLFGWTCEYDPVTQTFIYIACALTPSNTPVPEGFSYRDIPETLCAIGLYGESVDQTLKRASEQSFTPNWDTKGCGWNAEVYFHAEELNPPKKANSPWHWLIPVRPVSKSI